MSPLIFGVVGQTGGSFTPTDISGIELWLDASDTSTITDSSGSVSQWDDKSGNSRHAVQGTGSAQPSTGVATINSKNAIRFDGTTDFMQATPALGTANEFTWLIVATYQVTGVSEVLIGASNGGYASEDEWVLVRQLSGAYGGSVNGDTSAQDNGSVGTVDTNPHLWSARYTKSGDEFELLIDGTRQWIETSLTSSEPDLTQEIDIAAGDNGGSLFGYAQVDIAEILMYNSDLSIADREALEQYLAAKWGITLS